MKLKNVKIGTRVQLKIDDDVKESLKKGMSGTIIESNNYCPYISWDNFIEGGNGGSCKQTRIDLGLPERSVYSASIACLKRIK